MPPGKSKKGGKNARRKKKGEQVRPGPRENCVCFVAVCRVDPSGDLSSPPTRPYPGGGRRCRPPPPLR